MTLRSSPRKRLHLDGVASSSVMLSPQSNGQSPRKGIARTMSQAAASATTSSPSPLTTTPQSYTPQTKRIRMTESPIAQQNQHTPLAKILKGLSQTQLINVIQEIVNNEPNVETKVRTNLPMPDIKPMEEQLMLLKKNIFRSLPTSRLVKNTDSVGHQRAATHLSIFKKAVVEQSQQLHESENWDALIDYCLMAWQIVRATPIWDNKTHNSVRRSCFKILSWQCLYALKTAGIALGEQRLKDFLNQMAAMKMDCDDISSCESHVDNLLDQFDS